MKDLKKDLNDVIKTGKISIGANSAGSALLNSNPKLILLSGNCPNDIKEKVIYYSKLSNIPYKILANDSIEIGSMCGKPFPVSVLAILEKGESNILEMVKKR